MSLSYKFYLREISNSDKGALYLRVTYQRRSIVKSLGVILPVEHYDEHRQIVLANTPEAIKANALINEYMQMLKLIYHHAALYPYSTFLPIGCRTPRTGLWCDCPCRLFHRYAFVC